MPGAANASAEVNVTPEGVCDITLSGDWNQDSSASSATQVIARIPAKPSELRIDAAGVGDWDSTLPSLLFQLSRYCEQRSIRFSNSGLPDGAGEILQLALAVPERADARRSIEKKPLLQRVGERWLAGRESRIATLRFLGELTLSFGRMLRGKVSFQRREFLVILQDASAKSLGIVTLICFLIGVILAFIGGTQLSQFGATIYVANLVAIAQVREMAPIMTAIIMAGRTGAAYAAQLGTMKVNEEIDALTTMGFAPVDYLVLPRVLALSMMVPLLALYGDVVGIIGGAVIGVFSLDITPVQYWQQTISTIDMTQVSLGLIKAFVYGVLVAFAGCLRGVRCGSSASAVGEAATSAVVTGIVLIMLSSAMLTVLYSMLGY